MLNNTKIAILADYLMIVAVPSLNLQTVKRDFQQNGRSGEPVMGCIAIYVAISDQARIPRADLHLQMLKMPTRKAKDSSFVVFLFFIFYFFSN